MSYKIRIAGFGAGPARQEKQSDRASSAEDVCESGAGMWHRFGASMSGRK